MNAPLNVPQSPSPSLDACQPIGQIAVQLPGSTAVFRRLKLDFCCNGQLSLKEAATLKGLDADAIVAELNCLQRADAFLAPTDTDGLIELILTRFHAVHREQVPELITMARRVEAIHSEHPEVPRGLTAHLEFIEGELLSHMEKEEQILFPMLKAGGNPFVEHPIGVMRAEHIQHGLNLESLAALTHDATPPQDACTTWRALYAGIARLHEDLINHIHLENNVLFPRFEHQDANSGCDGSACHCA